ncbi:TPA: hypothetical protein ACH3X3_010044 [Trebouxia sp. C0006]
MPSGTSECCPRLWCGGIGVVMIMTTELDKGQPAPHLALTREDPSLEQHVRHNRLTVRRVVAGCQQLAEAWAAVACMADGGGLPAASLGPCCMHAEGIMHHDCRLGNLLLKLAGHAWPLSDFGFAAPAAFQGASGSVLTASNPSFYKQCSGRLSGSGMHIALGPVLLTQIYLHPCDQAGLVTKASLHIVGCTGDQDFRDLPVLRAHWEYLQALIGPEETYASQVTETGALQARMRAASLLNKRQECCSFERHSEQVLEG